MRRFFSESRSGWSWKREKAQSPVAGTRELLGSASWPRAEGNPPKCRRCSAGSSIWLQRAQKAKGTYLSLWRPPKPWQTVLASGDDPSLCGWRGSSNLVILLAYHLLDVEFLLVREQEVRQHAVGHLLDYFPGFLSPHGHIIDPLASGNTASWRASSTPGAWWIFSHRLRWPRFCSFG